MYKELEEIAFLSIWAPHKFSVWICGLNEVKFVRIWIFFPGNRIDYPSLCLVLIAIGNGCCNVESQGIMPVQAR
jgi:hypothetical protein